MKKYRIFDHTADLGIEVRGVSLADLFDNAVSAVADMTADRERVKAQEIRVIRAEGSDREDLWVNFLREVLYAVNGERFLIAECHIKEIDDTHVAAEVRGEPLDPLRHEIKKELKAVTYHQASIKQDAHGLRGRVILDV
ncbi:MAG: archease [Deltaproteobacteria bacterium]|nr:archease [Deltaproteobacteria bacterium]